MDATLPRYASVCGSLLAYGEVSFGAQALRDAERGGEVAVTLWTYLPFYVLAMYK